MFVHGEQADTILASLLALMASPQSLSRCFVVRLSLVQHALSSPPSLIKTLLSSYLTEHIQGKNTVSGAKVANTEATQNALVKLKFLFRSCKMQRLQISPGLNQWKPALPS